MSNTRPMESAESTVVTHCAQCGGAAREVSGSSYLQCEYCQSLVFPHGNPLTVDQIIPVDGGPAAQCPCCEGELQPAAIDRHHAMYCNRCYGILLRSDAFAQALRGRRAARSQQERSPAEPVDPAAIQRRTDCPVCHKAMETHPYYGPGNTVIDSCSRCQLVWLDHGELAELVRTAGAAAPASPSVPQATSDTRAPSMSRGTYSVPVTVLDHVLDLFF